MVFLCALGDLIIFLLLVTNDTYFLHSILYWGSARLVGQDLLSRWALPTGAWSGFPPCRAGVCPAVASEGEIVPQGVVWGGGGVSGEPPLRRCSRPPSSYRALRVCYVYSLHQECVCFIQICNFTGTDLSELFSCCSRVTCFRDALTGTLPCPTDSPARHLRPDCPCSYPRCLFP